jgi:hypothetical protein
MESIDTNFMLRIFNGKSFQKVEMMKVTATSMREVHETEKPVPKPVPVRNLTQKKVSTKTLKPSLVLVPRAGIEPALAFRRTGF